MKNKRWALVFVLIGLIFGLGCDDDCWDDDCYKHDSRPPAVPTGFYSVTDDEQVRLYWDHNHESDLDGYRIYWNDEPSGWFEFMAFTRDNYYIDRDVTNGETYFYALAAVDYNGNESDLTYEDVFDTPRPAGYTELYTFNDEQWAHYSGWDFFHQTTRHWDDPRTDMFYEYIWDDQSHRGYHYLNVTGTNVQIQPWGYIEDLDEITWAPSDGWTDREWVELDEDMAYVLRISKPEGELHYAKIYIRRLEAGMVRLEWAYQVDSHNKELVILPKARPIEADAK